MTEIIGYTVTRYWCRACAPEAILDGGCEIKEGSDYGVPYHCDDCGSALVPCEHEWDEWWPASAGGETRTCKKPNCYAAEDRDTPRLASNASRDAQRPSLSPSSSRGGEDS